MQNSLLQNFQELLTLELERRKQEMESYVWENVARPNQLPPKGNWKIWLILAGRGFGKTRMGAETIRAWVDQKIYQHIALIAETENEGRRVMIEGPSGLLNIYPPKETPLYEPSKRKITWKNGAVATTFSADAYEQLRGPQFDAAWIDELAKFNYDQHVWDQLMFVLRLGKFPRVIITTTPRPTSLLKKLIKNPDTVITRGTTFENAANLAEPFLSYMKQNYENTRLGRQELYAELLEENEEALWTHKMIERAREAYIPLPLKRIIIAIDPAVTSKEHSDETGIIAAGITQTGIGVILEDLSMKGMPSQWIQRAIVAYKRLKADRIVAEVNMGGELVEQLLRTFDPSLSYKSLHATRGKMMRAEPIAALYEQGKVWHASTFPELEKQLCNYSPQSSIKSPDRLDALVWALSELMLTASSQFKVWQV
ncbi:terminase family protein [Kamptonema cortianum]|jgi:phage terminase large subunit-like protein|nr:terminase family protein [Geitlerinema splendidum]MDK3160657.1 terminase family protein [Kamptonema cortianum]